MDIGLCWFLGGIICYEEFGCRRDPLAALGTRKRLLHPLQPLNQLLREIVF